MKNIKIHLISDSVCDSLVYMSRDVFSRFQSKLTAKTYVWSFVGEKKMLRILNIVRKQKNRMIIYNIANLDIRQKLKDFCRNEQIMVVPAFAHLIKEVSCFCNVSPNEIGMEELLTFRDTYSSRIEAMNYAISHDDGKNIWDLTNADIVIVGASRTSKTPTSIYLSSQGYKVANIPYVLGVDMDFFTEKINSASLTVGFYIQVEHLFAIRNSRLYTIGLAKAENYASHESIKEEIKASRLYFQSKKWMTLDVTYKSVEEIAAQIIKEL
ncbi:kinase/pyrophosphorylase [Anaplasmataceae bacterium AB001_6]|nr:kinase/pyrophosphorylase [Anaplasmataceae bacterium AB001_6]